MICPSCHGSGWDDENMIKCLRCLGSGKVNMTNEDYIKSCTTKQLADVLFKIWENGYNSTTDIHTPFSFLFGEKWLKEEHK